jgi:phosphoribosyl-ATP pyrophosphohydrolase/phosphoribosyl-AMP cyclohydrolase
MMAYMNRESLKISIRENRTCFWSRSRGELWRKGETSGNTQRVVSITPDCDGDTLLIKVIKSGPACHTGAESCFNGPLFADEAAPEFSLPALYELIAGRKNQAVEGSYTSYLFQKGLDKILKKVGEEATEVIIAAKNADNQELVYELADLVYHAMVLMAQQGITVDDVATELGKRHVVDKKVKQERMQ